LRRAKEKTRARELRTWAGKVSRGNSHRENLSSGDHAKSCLRHHGLSHHHYRGWNHCRLRRHDMILRHRRNCDLVRNLRHDKSHLRPCCHGLELGSRDPARNKNAALSTSVAPEDCTTSVANSRVPDCRGCSCNSPVDDCCVAAARTSASCCHRDRKNRNSKADWNCRRGLRFLR